MSRASGSRSTSLQEALATVYGPTLLILLGILSIALLLRTQHLEAISFWYDEACSWRISLFPVSEMMNAIARDAHPPMYYFVLKGWMKVFDTEAATARQLSVLCGVLTVLAGWIYAWTCVALAPSKSERSKADPMWEQLVPLLAAMLLALCPLLIELSHEARPYALGTLLALSAGTSLLWAAKYPDRGALWVVFSICVTALTMTHYYGLFTTAAMLLWGVIEIAARLKQSGWSAAVRRFSLGLAASSIAVLLSWLPWLSTFQFQRGRAHGQLWTSEFTWDGFMTTCWQALAGGRNSDLIGDAGWLAPAVWGMACLLVFARCGTAGRLTALCAAVPLVASIVYGFGIRNILEVRYLSFAVVFLIVGGAQVLGRERFAAIRTVGVVAAIGWLGYWTAMLSLQRGAMAQHPGTHGAVSYINSNRTPESPVVVGSPFVLPIVLQYIKEPVGVWTVFSGDHRAHLLSGAALRREDYDGLREALDANPATVWVVDIDGQPPVQLPKVYKYVSEENFSERFGGSMELRVRMFELKRGLELRDGA